MSCLSKLSDALMMTWTQKSYQKCKSLVFFGVRVSFVTLSAQTAPANQQHGRWGACFSLYTLKAVSLREALEKYSQENRSKGSHEAESRDFAQSDRFPQFPNRDRDYLPGR